MTFESVFETVPSLPPKRALLRCIQKTLHRVGASRLYRVTGAANGAIILMYHSVPSGSTALHIDPANTMPVRMFEAQMAMLARHRSVISLTDLVTKISNRESIRAGTVVITFDDGYLDNLEVVAPILQRLGLPAVLYLATGYIDRIEAQWIDQLYHAFKFRSTDHLDLESGKTVILGSNNQSTVYQKLATHLIEVDPDQRRVRLARVMGQLEPTLSLPKLTMSWDDVRQLMEFHPGFELGIHTHEHIDLTHASYATAELDVRRSLDCLERETGRVASHFSFPYGRHSEESRALVRSLGMKSAVLSSESLVASAESDPLTLGRIAAPADLCLLGYYTSGAHPGLSKMLLGQA